MEKENLERAVALRHELHQHPELACREVWTKQRLIDFLKQYTSLEIVDRGRWFYAIYHAGKDRPNIAFRADFDALPMDETIDLPYGSRFPGVAHKCGHDGHSACLAGFALEVNQRGADKNLYFLFQHAEETVEGALECAPLMDEAKITEIFGYHNIPGLPANSIVAIDGTACCGSTGMIISFKGIPAHASQPEDGRNPSFAIAEIVRSISEFTDPSRYKGLVMCTVIRIDVGEEAFGMSASEGRLMLTIRSQFDGELEELRQKIEDKTREQAAQYGLEYAFSFRDSVPATVNHRESADKVRRAARGLGLTVLEGDIPSRGSEDFGWFTRRTRGAMFGVGSGEGRAPIHTVQFDFNDEIIPAVVDLYGALANE
ncbi:MAG: amidohydrolase [Spirochaetaceae bacterium]|jgi:amidohydrolase|nr:amidohydrolase [Spirochaetaceae bacterium]